MPKVSVIIPNYNHGRYLYQRMESVFNQTYPDFEVLVLDDASTDNSRDIIGRWRSNPRIRVMLNEVNSGSVFKQWNKGLREASGEFVWIAESDDYCEPQFLETLLTRLENNPSAGIAYCQSWVVDENGNKRFVLEETRGGYDADRWRHDFSNNGRDECARYFIMGCMITNASSAVLRRSVVEKVGYAEENWTIAGDYAFWVRMLLESDIEFVAQPLNYWRHHASTVRSQATRNGVMVKEAYEVAALIARSVNIPDSTLEKARAIRFHMWMCYNEDYRFGFRQNRAIYEAARRFDPAIRRRVAFYIPQVPLRVLGRPLKRRLSAFLGAKSGSLPT